MSRKPKAHIAATEKHSLLVLRACPFGGFAVSKLDHQPNIGQVQRNLAVFTNLDDALDWLRANVAQPAQSAVPAKGAQS